MEKNETYSNSNGENFAIETGIALAEATSLLRVIAENLGIVKVQPLGKKKPEGSKLWKKVKNAPKDMIDAIDRLVGIEQKENGNAGNI